MYAQGRCHRAQRSNPAWAQGLSCVRKGCRKPCRGRDTCTGSSCISAPALAPGPCLNYAAALPTPAQVFHRSLPPSLVLELLHPRGCGHSPQPGSTRRFWGNGTGPWGGVPAPNCPAAACPGGAEPRPLLPIAEALLAWRSIHNIKKACNSFYSLFHCKNNRQSESKRKKHICNH